MPKISPLVIVAIVVIIALFLMTRRGGGGVVPTSLIIPTTGGTSPAPGDTTSPDQKTVNDPIISFPKGEGFGGNRWDWQSGIRF